MIYPRIRKSLKEIGKWVIESDLFNYVQQNGTIGDYFSYATETEAQTAVDLYHAKQDVPQSFSDLDIDPMEIRQFDSGATRDTDEGKLSYVKALSPIALQRYVEYLGVHRKQPDGSMRDWDNWKKGIPEDVYLDGLGRHFLSVWLLAHGFPAEDNHGPVDLVDSLCGVIFNAIGWLHETIKPDRTKPVPNGY